MTDRASARQKTIYLEGFGGALPAIPTDFEALEGAARRAMTPRAFAYIAGGAGNESTISENRLAFGRVRIVPRMLRDVSEIDTSVKLFGTTLSSPFLLSPIGVLELAHKQADLAVARAAAATGVPMIFSNQASYNMEDCAGVMGESPRWFQLYWSKSKKLVESFVRRAEACGCSAIVITLDTTMLGWRTRDLNLGYLPFLEGRGIAQYTSDPVFLEMIKTGEDDASVKRKLSYASVRGLISMVRKYPGGSFLSKLRSSAPIRAVRTFIGTYSNASTTWKDLEWMRSLTSLPILLKGILHPDDAQLAIKSGMNGIIVSNHGGRQVDGAVATIDALPLITNSVKGRIPVILDSGIRGGADAFKALALGANAVCIGRPYVYALALGGERGVRELLANYRADFELTMGLAGCKNIAAVNREMVTRTAG